MSWTLHRWTWLLEGPLYVGAPPAGSLNRCRLYVPARALWGALTAEAARALAGEDAAADYQAVGDTLRDHARLTYLYPAERSGERWVAWLPRFEDGAGLCWQREDGRGEPVPDRPFRRRLLTTRPGTAIDPASDSAAERSLRETECVSDRWRDGQEDDRVACVGYVFTRTEQAKKRALEVVETLFLGGDTRYGLGRMRRLALDEARDVFGARVTLGGRDPQLSTGRVLAHTEAGGETTMRGAKERLVGWDNRARAVFAGGAPLWQPGSRAGDSLHWRIEASGSWSHHGAQP